VQKVISSAKPYDVHLYHLCDVLLVESILNVTCYAKILVTKSVTEIARSPKRRKSLLCDTWDVIKGLGHHEYQKLGSRLRFKPRQDQFYAVNFYCHSSSVAVPCCVHLQAANDDWLNLSNLTFFCNQQSSPGYRKAYLDASCSFDLPFNFLECFPYRHRVRSGGCHDDFLFQCSMVCFAQSAYRYRGLYDVYQFADAAYLLNLLLLDGALWKASHASDCTPLVLLRCCRSRSAGFVCYAALKSSFSRSHGPLTHLCAFVIY